MLKGERRDTLLGAWKGHSLLHAKSSTNDSHLLYEHEVAVIILSALHILTN